MTLLPPVANHALPTRTVVAMSGSNPTTLCTWERGYHFIEPAPTSKGRQYSKKQVAMLHSVPALLERGAPVFVGGPASVILGGIVQQAGATVSGADGGVGLQRIALRLNDGDRPSATDKNKNTRKQISQENSCRSQV